MGPIRTTFLLLFALAGAAALSQFPEFYQQYLQRLSGRADEVSAQVTALDARAAAAGLDRFDYVRAFSENSDRIVRGEGQAMVALLGRQVRLAAAVHALRESAPAFQPFAFAENFYWEDAQATAAVYAPALPLTLAGGVYALVGFLCGSLLFSMLMALIPRRRWRRARARA
ncbi:MAG: DUF2937 family protein [Alphaproteobacteria bacterium]